MDIKELKSNGITPNVVTPTEEVVDPNVTAMREKQRDLGNGLKEVSPTNLGFEPEQVDTGEDDIDAALNKFDADYEKKVQEVQEFCDAIDAAGGELTEAEFREMRGESYITEMLKDGETTKTPSVIKDDINTHKSEKEPVATITIPVGQAVISKVTITPSNDVISKEDKDLAALDDGTGNIERSNDFESKLKNAVNRVIKTPEFSEFTVDNRPVTVSNAISASGRSHGNQFKWPMMNSKRPIVMNSFSAIELTELQNLNDSEANNSIRDQYQMIWDHIAEGKGSSFDAWAKATSYYDINHIWMAVYGACYSKSNYLPYSCDSCKDVMITTDTPIMDMVSFKNDDAKKKFEEIKAMSTTDDIDYSISEKIIPISDSFAVGLVEPTIYNSVIEPSLLDDNFKKEYSDILNISMYINNFYLIDKESNTVRPISLTTFANNKVKTTKAKFIQWTKILKTLTSDEFNRLYGQIVTMDKNSTDVTYKLPEVTCEHCGKVIPEDSERPAQLVFTRHRLALYGIL